MFRMDDRLRRGGSIRHQARRTGLSRYRIADWCRSGRVRHAHLSSQATYIRDEDMDAAIDAAMSPFRLASPPKADR